jgi:Fic family protein
MAFGGRDLYPTLAEKAAALALSLAGNHPFVDGNKRVAHAAMEVFLVLNGREIEAKALTPDPPTHARPSLKSKRLHTSPTRLETGLLRSFSPTS